MNTKYYQFLRVIVGVALVAAPICDSALAASAKPAKKSASLSQPECVTIFSTATPVINLSIPSPPYISTKGEFEKTVIYKDRVAHEIDEYNKIAAAAASVYQAFSLNLPLSTKYDADRELLSFESPYVSKITTEVVGGTNQSFTSVSSTDGEASVVQDRVGNSKVGINTSTKTHHSLGLAFIKAPNHHFLQANKKHSLHVPATKAAQIANGLDLVVVGTATTPWRFDTLSSGESLYANGTVFQDTYYSNYFVVNFVCALLVERASGKALDIGN